MSSPSTPLKRRSPTSNSKRVPSPSKWENIVGANINTFVFMKCHVTNINKPRLTELAMVAVSKVDLTHDQGCGDATGTVRYKDTLVLSFDPEEPIHCQDGANSDLTHSQLKENKKAPFDRAAVNGINNFLQMQARPICMLAHNGRAADFKVLKEELERLNLTIFGTDGDKLYCADTLWLLYGMDHHHNNGGRHSNGVSWNLFDVAESPDRQVRPNDPTVLDYARYSFENVYRRFVGKFPDPHRRTAEDYAILLFDVLRNTPREYLHLIPGQTFSNIFHSGDVSPSKQRKIESGVLQGEMPNTSTAENSDSIQTFVFLDLETTGLDPENVDIAEISMAAVHRSQLNMVENDGRTAIIPRVADKCNLMIRPLRDIPDEASRVNRLTTEGYAIRNISPFTDRVMGTLRYFLERQVKPICLVAHNGHRFDFPILKLHLRSGPAGDIWNELHCSDTLIGLRELRQREGGGNGLGRAYNELTGDNNVNKVPIALPEHTAEGDVLRLITITRLLPEGLLDWLELNKGPFKP